MCRQIQRVLFLRNVCCELLRRFGIIAVFPLQFLTQFCEWNFHNPAREADYDAVRFDSIYLCVFVFFPVNRFEVIAQCE